MSGIGVKIVVDDKAVKGAFARLLTFGDDQTPAMTAIGAQMRLHVDERFEDEQGPGGVPWLKSKRALFEKGQTLTQSSRLKQSITFRAERNAVEIGTNVRYAAIHQFGGTIRAKGKKGLVFKVPGGGFRRLRQVTIPARPFLGLDRQDIAEIEAIVDRHIARMASGGGSPPA